MNSDKKKLAEWQKKLAHANELKILPMGLIEFLSSEILQAESLILGGRSIFKESVSLDHLAKMALDVSNSKIDLNDECGHLVMTNDKAKSLQEKINRFLKKEERLRLHEIEKIIEETKDSCIDYEGLGIEVEKMLQICKAFTVAIKEMKKTPIELKKARHTYQQIP